MRVSTCVPGGGGGGKRGPCNRLNHHRNAGVTASLAEGSGYRGVRWMALHGERRKRDTVWAAAMHTGCTAAHTTTNTSTRSKQSTHMQTRQTRQTRTNTRTHREPHIHRCPAHVGNGGARPHSGPRAHHAQHAVAPPWVPSAHLEVPVVVPTAVQAGQAGPGHQQPNHHRPQHEQVTAAQRILQQIRRRRGPDAGASHTTAAGAGVPTHGADHGGVSVNGGAGGGAGQGGC
jgi:hypothetical protein